MRSLGLWLLTIFISGSAYASSCKYNLLPKQFSGFVRVSSQRELFVKFESPKSAEIKGYVVLVHGLLDSHKRYDKMSKLLLKKGYGVLRMDLYGFGQSLVRELERNKGDLNFLMDLPFEKNVEDLRDILYAFSEKYGIQSFQLMGHSMGGGLAAALMANPDAKKWLDRVVMVAPYIYRMERFELQSAIKSTNPWRAWMPPMVNSIWDAHTEDLVKKYLDANDAIGDGYLKTLLKEQFEKHLEELGYGDAPKEVKDALLVSALATIRGLRDLDVIDKLDEISANKKLDLVISLNDELVKPAFQEKLATHLENRNSNIYRLETDHMVPTEAPKKLVEILTEDRPTRP